MKTLLKILIPPLVILAGGSWGVYNYYYGGEAIIHKSQHLVKRKMKNQILVNRRPCITINNLRLIKTAKKRPWN